MYAIIETGGKQYRVEKGDRITIEKLGIENERDVVFDKVLMVGDGADIKVGAPYVDGVIVGGNAIESSNGKKVVIFKYKAKKNYRKKQGHRQPYTLVEIDSIKEHVASQEEVVARKGTSVGDKKLAKKSSLKSMKKAELIGFAEKNGIRIDEKTTNAIMIETIEAALNVEK